MSEKNLYELQDVVATFGSKANVAWNLNIDPSQVTRWGKSIPGAKQIELMRLFDRHPDIYKDYRAEVKLRKHRELWKKQRDRDGHTADQKPVRRAGRVLSDGYRAGVPGPD
jgi:hypothetical protein